MKSLTEKKVLLTLKHQRILFLIILVFSCCCTVFGQETLFRASGKNKIPNQYKYGFYVTNGKGVIHTQKKDVVDFIQGAKLDTGMYVTANNKIISFYPIENSANTNVLRNIRGIFKVVNVEVKKDNYYVKGDYLKKTKLYMYDVEQECPEESTFKYIRIIVFQHEFGNNVRKMKLGYSYNLGLSPLLQTDCCSPAVINGDTIYRLRQSRALYTYIIKGVLVPRFSFGDYNIVEISEVANNDEERKMQIGH